MIKFTERKCTKKRVQKQQLRIPRNYIITTNTSPHLFPFLQTDFLVFKTVKLEYSQWCSQQAFSLFVVCVVGFFKGVFHSLVPYFCSETLADLDPTLGEHQFCLPVWAQLSEVSLQKPLCSSARHIKTGAGIHHYFYAAELIRKISENKSNACRSFRPCQKMAYYCVSKHTCSKYSLKPLQ